MSTAFVFAGGGSLGAVEVGMLEALVEHGARADFVVGASAGAINAAYYAGRPDAPGVARLAAIWRRLRSADVFPIQPLHGLLGFVGLRKSLLDPAPLRALLARELPYQRLEQARLPCHLVATDVLDGSEVVLSSGPVVEALLASAAIPGVFPPQQLGGRHLIDGGISSNTPVSTAVGLGAKRIVVLPTGFACALTKPPAGAVAMALHALTLLVARQLVSDVLRWQERVEIVVVPPLCPVESSPYDFSASAALIERAAASTRAWLAAGGLERPGVPHELTPHAHEVI
jgi:NTE family protein